MYSTNKATLRVIPMLLVSFTAQANDTDPRKAIDAQLDVTSKIIRQTIERVTEISQVRLPVNLKDYNHATSIAIRNLNLSLEYFENALTKQVVNEELAILMAQYNTSYHLIEDPKSRTAFLKQFKESKLLPALEARELQLQQLTQESLKKIGIPFFRTVFTKRSKRTGGRIRELDESENRKNFATVINDDGIVLGSYHIRDPDSFIRGIKGPFNSDPIDQIIQYKQSLVKTGIFEKLPIDDRSLKTTMIHAINHAPRGARVDLPDEYKTWYDTRYMHAWFNFSPAKTVRPLTESEYTNLSFEKGTFAFRQREIVEDCDYRNRQDPCRYIEKERPWVVNQGIDRVVDTHITEIFPDEPVEWRQGVAEILVTNLKRSCPSQVCVTLLADQYHYLLRTLTLGLFAKSYIFTLADGSNVGIHPRGHQWFSVYRALQQREYFPLKDLPFDN